MGKVLDAGKVHSQLKEKLLGAVKGMPPLTLASVEVGRNFDSGRYCAQQKKIAQELGIKYISVPLDSSVSFDSFEKKVNELNDDPTITGIIVNKPFPSEWKEEVVFSIIDPFKDIEGMTPTNLGLLVLGHLKFLSPTVQSIMTFLGMTGENVRGKDVVIVGSSILIGKPLAIILSSMFATVSVTHIATSESGRLPFYVSNADIVISAVGKPDLIRGEWIKEGAVIIDVGVGTKDGKMVGDVEFDVAKGKASFITPVPGGVGKLTTLFLFKNLVKSGKILANFKV